MSATQTRRARADRFQGHKSQENQTDAEIAKHATAISATPELFATSGMPQAAALGGTDRHADRERQEAAATATEMTIAEARWAKFWAAADSGAIPDPTEADGGDLSNSDSFLAGLMRDSFDDDERWRELARTGRAL